MIKLFKVRNFCRFGFGRSENFSVAFIFPICNNMGAKILAEATSAGGKMYSPSETVTQILNSGIKKTRYTYIKTFLLAVAAGAFIAFAAEGSNVAIHNIAAAGLGKALAGALFSTGLMMVVVGGAELFTGNTLIAVSCLAKQNKWSKMFANLGIVFVGNFIGSMLIVVLVFYSGQFNMSGGAMGGFAIKVAANKTSLSFLNGVCSGILCCWLVCMGVWMAASAKDVTGKLLACFFPIWLFITSGFEHSIANMFYIPAGLLAKTNPLYVGEALNIGVTQAALDKLTWGRFFYANLLPVTIGNLIGGVVFVAGLFFFSFKERAKKVADENNASLTAENGSAGEDKNK